ncbi:hypothetical protein CN894_11745 [Bacillus thuringiensis]|uniref:pyridoxal phosphate-dependent aminotransferase n=1 Tax=Bacillus thuringiensis TaxID=1428 RepID=UPI000BFB1332|nr:pyridoxal phosphate-dependent aminotransferase [Bacillus thuringiensis]PGH72152.1 hypothetical protein CN894_11745 [Bacillus thuringiensis]
MNIDLEKTRPHSSKQISDLVSHDPTIINLTVGEPSYGPPLKFLEEITKLTQLSSNNSNQHLHRYTHSLGDPHMRIAIERYYQRLYGMTVDPETQVLITHGGAEAIWLTIFTLTNPGDEVIIADPSYILYEMITLSLGRCPVRIPTRIERGFRMDPDDIRRAMTNRTRLLILNSPENPTGALYTRSDMVAILKVAEEWGIRIMHDEVFDRFAYGGEHVPIRSLDIGGNTTIMINSLSKRFGMTGWRLGWLVGPSKVVSQAAKAHTYFSLSTGTLVQQAAATVLNDPNVDTQLVNNVTDIQGRGQRFMQKLLDLELFEKLSEFPKGGFYLFLRPSPLFQKYLTKRNSDGIISELTAWYLLDKCRVAVVPGNSFGPSGEDYVRLSFVAPEEKLDAAVDRFLKLLI